MKTILRAIAKLHAGRAGSLEKVRSGLDAEPAHLVGQIADFCLGVQAAAYGKPVPQGVGVHADDSLELRGLRLEIAQVLLRQAGVKAGIVPLSRKVGEIATRKHCLSSVGERHPGREVGGLLRIDNGKGALAAEFLTP